ncbi:mobile mystery protein A [Bdellovibrio bacteriovorus]|uniref:Transcriptional regulator n=1 Tax=Bdellovibrio bacteriovorus str. Tiberius TaxID=1069642 RepID=K7ZFC5_BDEBC|nr:mobile mystery protein A [Bdellovibrio bacteriovorus]AFY01387.1 transcriptional regulator [Bdellovibrio bacteriovorus str. Tiberius]
MKSKTAKLRRAQLDQQFMTAHGISSVKTPKTGWVREVRTALGMSMSDLAARLGVIKQRIEGLEKNEVAGTVTIESLRKAAEAMNCDFVYHFVPKQGLQKTLESQASKVAEEIVRSSEHSMSLELQSTSKSAQKALVEEIALELLRNEDRRIWSLKK